MKYFEWLEQGADYIGAMILFQTMFIVAYAVITHSIHIPWYVVFTLIFISWFIAIVLPVVALAILVGLKEEVRE